MNGNVGDKNIDYKPLACELFKFCATFAIGYMVRYQEVKIFHKYNIGKRTKCRVSRGKERVSSFESHL